MLVIDGMEGATGASPEALLDHTGIPTMRALCEAVRVAGRDEGARRGADRDLGRDQERRRCGEGARAGRRRGFHRHGGADRAQLQRAAVPGGLREARRRAWRLPPLPHGPVPGGHHNAGSGADAAAGDRWSRRPRLQLPAVDDHGDADARARVWQERRPRPGSRGHACAHAGVLTHHGDPARRDGLRADSPEAIADRVASRLSVDTARGSE